LANTRFVAAQNFISAFVHHLRNHQDGMRITQHDPLADPQDLSPYAIAHADEQIATLCWVSH
jgi:hypothetical protein